MKFRTISLSRCLGGCKFVGISPRVSMDKPPTWVCGNKPTSGRRIADPDKIPVWCDLRKHPVAIVVDETEER